MSAAVPHCSPPRDESHLIDDRETRGEVGKRGTGVRKNVGHIWHAWEPVRVMHLATARLVSVGKPIRGQPQGLCSSVRWGSCAFSGSCQKSQAICGDECQWST